MRAAQRLDQVLTALAEAPAARVDGAVRAIVLKSNKPEPREALDRLLASWHAARAPRPSLEARPHEPPAPEPEPKKAPKWLWALLALALLLGALIYATPDGPEPMPDMGLQDAAAQDAAPDLPDLGVDLGPQLQTYPFPQITTRAQPPTTATRWPDALLAALALLGLALIWRHRAQLEDPPTIAPPKDDRPPLPPRPVGGPIELLDPQEARDLEWGVTRYQSQEHTHHLDLRATVAATAREGGVFTLRYQRARRPREIWLWCDRSAVQRHPELRQLSHHIMSLLRRAGLPVERAWFWGLPDALRDDDGVTVPIEAVAERRDFAHIALLTDGHLLNAWRDDAEVHAQLAADLRRFARWPRFALVDFSPHTQALRPLARAHDLTLLAPHQLAGWLSGARRTATTPMAHAVERWIAACALSLDPVAESTALALRDHLDLAVPNWALSALRQRSDGPSGRLRFEPAAALTWLAHAEAGPQSTLDRARAFWVAHYRAAPAPPDSRAQRWFALAAQLTALWTREPAEVAPIVNALNRERGSFKVELEATLSQWCPSDTDDPELAHLPWPWAALDAPTQRTLKALGFGGLSAHPAPQLERGHRVQFAMAACAVTALVCTVAWFHAAPQPSAAPHRVVESGARPADFYLSATEVGLRRYTEPVGTQRGMETHIDWAHTTPHPCVEQLGDDTILRCGTVREPQRGPGQWPTRSQFVLGFPEAQGRRLALRLLDTGVADEVRFTAHPAWIPTPPEVQRVVISPAPSVTLGTTTVATDDPDALAAELGSGPPVPLHTLWGKLAQIAGPKAVGSGGACVPGRRKTVRGVEFVQLCGGEFQMGSEEGDDDERPVHGVRLTPFWMARSETTVAQYRACVDAKACKAPSTYSDYCNWDKKEREDHPINCVSWEDATAFAQWLGARLPTEAQWEYAARGQAGRTYPWGDAKPSCEYAVMDDGVTKDTKGDDTNGCGRDSTWPVCAKPAGDTPEGLCNLGGNLWEWMEDCYHDDTYAKRAGTKVTNPTLRPCEPQKTGRWGRVLRGGSFFSAWVMRSAFRDGSGPTDRDWLIGFRCVLSPRPQLP